MKRLAIASILAGVLIGFSCSAQAQGCYGGAYGAAAPQGEPFGFAVGQPQTQTFTVPVTVTVTTQPVAVSAPAPVALPAPVCPSVGFAQPYAMPYAQSFATVQCPQVGFSFNQQFGGNFHGGRISPQFGFNSGFVGGFTQQLGGAVVAGRGVSVSARDRQGNQVVASGVNSVRIRRGFLGRINGADADSNRGLLGRISPF